MDDFFKRILLGNFTLYYILYIAFDNGLILYPGSPRKDYSFKYHVNVIKENKGIVFNRH